MWEQGEEGEKSKMVRVNLRSKVIRFWRRKREEGVGSRNYCEVVVV